MTETATEFEVFSANLRRSVFSIYDRLVTHQGSVSCCGYIRSCDRRVVAVSSDDSFLAWSSEADVLLLYIGKSLDENGAVSERSKVHPIVLPFDTVYPSSDQHSQYWLRKIYCRSRVTALCFGNVSLNQVTSPLGFGRDVRLKDHTNAVLLAVGLECGAIRIYSAVTGKFLIDLLDHRGAVEDLTFSPRYSLWHSMLLSCSRDSTLKLWDLYDGGNMFRTLKGHMTGEYVVCCAWSSNGLWAASGGTDRRLIVWRTRCWSIHRRTKMHRNCIVDCEFSPDSALLVSCSSDSTAIVFDHIKGCPLVTLRHELPVPLTSYHCATNRHRVNGLSFSSDGEHIVTICSDNNMRIWNISSPQFPCKIVPMRNATSVCYFKNGTSIAVCSHRGTLEIRSAPMSVQRLSAICRKVLRSTFCLEMLRQCLLPKELHSYLEYGELLLFEDCRPILPCPSECRRQNGGASN
ncbi:hypothetical protein M514_10894, partial [Trichuris suis]